MYHIIIRIFTCPILWIPVPDVLREARWPLSSHNRCYQERVTAQAVAMDLIDQLSTYIYVYVDNYHKIYSKRIIIVLP